MVIEQLKGEVKMIKTLLDGYKSEIGEEVLPLNVSKMTKAQLDAELEKGYADMQTGRTIPMEQAFAEIRKDYGMKIIKYD